MRFLFRVLSIFFITILVIELSLRMTLYINDWLARRSFLDILQQPKDQKKMYNLRDSSPLGWELLPGEYGEIQINSLKFRGDEPEASGAKRIALLGDSEVFGMNLKESDTLSVCLEAEFHRVGKNDVEVLNLGVPGYGLDQYLLRLKEVSKNLQLSEVILYLNFNDLDLSRRVFFLETDSLLEGLYTYKVYRLFRSNGFQISGNSNNLEQKYNEMVQNELFDDAIDQLMLLKQYIEGIGIRFTVVLAPEIYSVNGFSESYPYHEVHKKLHQELHGRFTFIDPLPALKETGAKPVELQVNNLDHHKNGKAHRAIAEFVVAKLTMLNSSTQE